jgi:Ran GTPase-activating protein (RanGAP) involved in mRNA processing and transport
LWKCMCSCIAHNGEARSDAEQQRDGCLTELDFSGSGLSHGEAGETCLVALAEAMKEHPYIRKLNLRDCSVKELGAVSIAEIMSSHPNLCELDFSFNQITTLGAKKIVDNANAKVVNSINLRKNYIYDTQEKHELLEKCQRKNIELLLC